MGASPVFVKEGKGEKPRKGKKRGSGMIPEEGSKEGPRVSRAVGSACCSLALPRSIDKTLRDGVPAPGGLQVLSEIRGLLALGRKAPRRGTRSLGANGRGRLAVGLSLRQHFRDQ